MSNDHETQKLRLTKGSDKSLTVSELNDLVAQAVEEALEPLKDRIRQLEQGKAPEEVQHLQIEAPIDSEPSSRRLDLDELDLEDLEESTISSARKKVR